MVEGLLMSTITDAVLKIKQEPRPSAGKTDNPFNLVSSVTDPAASSEISSAWQDISLPTDVADFWSVCRQARLFEDIDFGQWGLVLLDPVSSAERTVLEITERPTEFRSDDVVLGAFLGDQELLVIAPSDSGTRRILVALPLDPRSSWIGVGEDLGQFLGKYIMDGGDKFWERNNR
jgi:hypothetical protein